MTQTTILLSLLHLPSLSSHRRNTKLISFIKLIHNKDFPPVFRHVNPLPATTSDPSTPVIVYKSTSELSQPIYCFSLLLQDCANLHLVPLKNHSFGLKCYYVGYTNLTNNSVRILNQFGGSGEAQNGRVLLMEGGRVGERWDIRRGELKF